MPLATDVPRCDFSGATSRIQAASLDLTVGDIFTPGVKSDEPGGADAPRHDLTLSEGHTAIVRTCETLTVPDTLVAIGFPPASLSIKGVLMTNPGQVDPGYHGPLHLTIINMSKEPFNIRRGDRVIRLVFMRLDATPAANYGARHPGPARAPVNDALLRQLSVDFLDVERRAQEIANTAVNKAQWSSAFIAAGITVALSLLTGIVPRYFDRYASLEQGLVKLGATVDVAKLSNRLDYIETEIKRLSASTEITIHTQTMVEVTLLARPVFTDAHAAFLQAYLPPEDAHWREKGTPTPAERLVEFAGRVCYMSFGRNQSRRSNAEYIANLIRRGHESVLEHAVWTVALAGVTRAFTHQLVRHRVGFSFSQMSQQYHDERETPVIRPLELDRHPGAAAVWDTAMRASRDAYATLVTALGLDDARSMSGEVRRALRSAARSVLPNATESIVVVTANARGIRYFLRVRGTIPGDSEMRLVAAALLETLRPEGPALFADFTIIQPGDGLPLLSQTSL